MFRVLRQKAAELAALETHIAEQTPRVEAAFDEGNTILSRMRALTVEPGPIEARAVAFSEEAVRLRGLITQMRQLTVATLVARAAQDLAASVVLPELDSRTAQERDDQAATITSVLGVLGRRTATLEQAAQDVVGMAPAREVTFTPVSAADAVILYAGSFVPSRAGAIAIDLLPGVLVLILAITHGMIREMRDGAAVEETMTVAEFRAALALARDIEDRPAETAPETPQGGRVQRIGETRP